jgi:hypothetical protein
LVSDEPGVPAGGGDQRELAARLRVVIEAQDAQNAALDSQLSRLCRKRVSGIGAMLTTV